MASQFVSHLNTTGDSIVSGPVAVEPFVPGSANLFPKMVNHINDSAWELWQFDGFSADGETAVSVSFYRDTRGLEKGGFHIDINAIWPDGSKWGEMLFFPESIVTLEGASYTQGRVQGVWKSATASTSFSIEANLSAATVLFSVPGRVTGTIEPRFMGIGGHESRLPAAESAALLGPSVYYLFPMGPASATTDLAFGVVDKVNGTVHEKRHSVGKDGGRGSIVRGWSALAFPQMFTDAYYLNAVIGPYMLQLIRIISSAATGRKPHTIARLYRDDELVCAAQHSIDVLSLDENLLAEDTVAVDKVLREDGGLAAAFCDKNTGYVIDLIERSGEGGTINFDHARRHRKRWHFEAHHKLAWWSEPTSAPGPQGTGKSGFIEAVDGGLDGGEMTFKGAGLAGQLQLP